ncbi:MAG: hypothetical protein DME69_06485 [Verrucomicrobia bacterium]|nr:MAG: hypothetical protein DME69_06485 [Verrucomicrobiota bacterium]PYL76814.1 MAG: hypothetical protein DMF26_05530 [Verrucomicrobiota bacterium]
MKPKDSQNESGEELRSQTDVEQPLPAGADVQALAKWIGDKLRKRQVPFQSLCNTERKKGSTEMIYGVKWKVYRTERGFNDLFWDFWREVGEKWKDADRKKPPTGCTESERRDMVALARDADAWKKRGEQMLNSWKRDGVGPADFLSLARFRGCYCFESQVKFITGQNRPDRALPWFRRFLKSHFGNEDMAEYLETAFPEDLDSLKDAFTKWKPEELSRQRREARGKRGRVKSKNDKRLGALDKYGRMRSTSAKRRLR